MQMQMTVLIMYAETFLKFLIAITIFYGIFRVFVFKIISSMREIILSQKTEFHSFSWLSNILETILLGEINQSQKDKYHIFSMICGR